MGNSFNREGVAAPMGSIQAANQNNDTSVVSHMTRRVYIHPRDANGRRLRPVRSNGPVNRRQLESAPFRRQDGRP